MKFKVNGLWGAGSSTLISVLVVLSIALCYRVFVQETNEYLGYLEISYGIFDYVVMGFAVIMLTLTLKSGVRRPSDFFFFIYTIFVIVPYCVLFKTWGGVDEIITLSVILLLSMPLLLLSLIQKTKFIISYKGFVSHKQTKLLLYGIVIMSTTLLFGSGIESVSFEMENSYVRRLEGRDVFQTGALASYVVSMFSNSVLPLMGFWAGFERRRFMFLLSIACCFMLFFFLGLKAPFFYLFIGMGFGLFGRRVGFSGICRLFVFLVLTVFLVSFMEIIAFDYSYVADYIIRRAFVVPPFLVSAYADMFFQSSGYWDLTKGVLADLPVSMVMGIYLGDSTLNANTNTFVYAFGAAGLWGYLFDVFLVCAAFAVMDNCFLQRRDPAWMWVGFLFSLLLVEQSSKTVLVSSGVALSLVLLFLRREPSD